MRITRRSAVYSSLAVASIAGLCGVVSSFTSDAAGVVSLDSFKRQQERAIVRKWEGTDALKELVGNQASLDLKVLYSNDESQDELLIGVNAYDALENACSASQPVPSPICDDYRQIPAAVVAQAKINSKYGWLDSITVGSLITMGVGGVSSILSMTLRRSANKSYASGSHPA